MDTALFLLLVGKHIYIERYAISDDSLQEIVVGTVARVMFDGFPASGGQVTILMRDCDTRIVVTPLSDYVKVTVFE